MTDDCTRCGSKRILSVNAHCKDLGYVEIAGQTHDGYVPDDLGIGGGDDVDFQVCLDCGQMQGLWPLPPCRLEQLAKPKIRGTPGKFALSIVNHVIKTNDGNVGAVLAMILDGWLTKTPDELVPRVAECVNALTDDPRTRSMGQQLAEVLEDWVHWSELEPLITDEEEDE